MVSMETWPEYSTKHYQVWVTKREISMDDISQDLIFCAVTYATQSTSIKTQKSIVLTELALSIEDLCWAFGTQPSRGLGREI